MESNIKKARLFKTITYNPFFLFLFSAGYALFGMLCLRCLFYVLGMMSPFSPEYPRFYPFCAIIGLFSFAVCIFLVIYNILLLLDTDKKVRLPIFIETIITIALCPVFYIIWSQVYTWLQVIF